MNELTDRQLLEEIYSMLTELVEAKRQVEVVAKELQGKGPLAMMGALRGFGG